jgi:hypothetical protein
MLIVDATAPPTTISTATVVQEQSEVAVLHHHDRPLIPSRSKDASANFFSLALLNVTDEILQGRLPGPDT